MPLLVFILLPFCAYGLYDPVNRIESARLYGNIDYYAYWYVDLVVGTPPQRVSVILDTGSGLTAFPCRSCKHCGRHIDPNFNIKASKTAQWQKCGRGCAGGCSGGHCNYHQGYQEGSSISGWWFSDYVRLGDGIQRNPPVHVNMGCHTDENKLFYTQKANGIFGVKGPNTLLQRLFKDKTHVNSRVFAMCLAEWGGRFVVGGFNKSYHTGTLQWLKMNSGFSVPLSGMQVGGKVFGGFRHAMVDSGTTYTYMGRGPYRALRAEIEGYCRKARGCGARLQGTCWNIPNREAGLRAFPVVKVYFGRIVSHWEPRGYLYHKGGKKSATFCYAFEDDGPGASTVLGASWMLHHEVVFDLVTNRLGLAPAECPQYKNRPDHSTTILDPPTVPPVTPSRPKVSTSTKPKVSTSTSTKSKVSTSTSTKSKVSTSTSTKSKASTSSSTKAGVRTSSTSRSEILSTSLTHPPMAAITAKVPYANLSKAHTHPPVATVAATQVKLEEEPADIAQDAGSTWAFLSFAKTAGLASISVISMGVFAFCVWRRAGIAIKQGTIQVASDDPQVLGSTDAVSTVTQRAAGSGATEEEQSSLVQNMDPENDDAND